MAELMQQTYFEPMKIKNKNVYSEVERIFLPIYFSLVQLFYN